jgi:hypothetical protein
MYGARLSGRLPARACPPSRRRLHERAILADDLVDENASPQLALDIA